MDPRPRSFQELVKTVQRASRVARDEDPWKVAFEKEKPLDSSEVHEVSFSESIIPLGISQRLDEVTFKHGGQIWRIYKNDADPFPSNPHAHNVETGLKLHLGNGRLYDGTKDLESSIRPRHLQFLQGELIRRKIISSLSDIR